MQIKKTYININPELLHDQVRDFVQKQGATLDKAQLHTYSLPGASTHIVRSTLIFKINGNQEETKRECIRVYIVGSSEGETKMMLDIDEKLFPEAKVSSLQEDLDFIFASYEPKTPEEKE